MRRSTCLHLCANRRGSQRAFGCIGVFEGQPARPSSPASRDFRFASDHLQHHLATLSHSTEYGVQQALKW